MSIPRPSISFLVVLAAAIFVALQMFVFGRWSPALFSGLFVAAQGLALALLFRLFAPAWWRHRWLRVAVWAVTLIGLGALILWWPGVPWTAWELTGMWITATVGVLQIATLIALPISGLIHGIDWGLQRLFNRSTTDETAEEKPNMARRRLLKYAAAAVPMTTIGLALGGKAQALAGITVYRRELAVPNLPPTLTGLRILHVSDLHLRHYVTVADIEPLLEQAADYRPDLVCVTGDVADDLDQLSDGLQLLSELKPPYGTYATLGNHEYFRGVRRVRQIYDRSPVPLLVNESVRVTINDSPVLIAGIDDPVRMRDLQSSFFETTIREATRERRADDTVILLSHRPDAFDVAATEAIDVTLAGHTHGGQIGFMGRSIFERRFPDRYLWGEYAKSTSRLYTSCGAGHWFPFRLGCPQEAPVIELIPS